jgi:hypothetical protein
MLAGVRAARAQLARMRDDLRADSSHPDGTPCVEMVVSNVALPQNVVDMHGWPALQSRLKPSDESAGYRSPPLKPPHQRQRRPRLRHTPWNGSIAGS